MAEKWIRAYRSSCIVCNAWNTTLYKLSKAYICGGCRLKFETKGAIRTHKDDVLFKREDGDIGYIPASEVVEVEAQDQKI